MAFSPGMILGVTALHVSHEVDVALVLRVRGPVLEETSRG